jgi:hypothetical protein
MHPLHPSVGRGSRVEKKGTENPGGTLFPVHDVMSILPEALAAKSPAPSTKSTLGPPKSRRLFLHHRSTSSRAIGRFRSSAVKAQYPSSQNRLKILVK